MKIWDSVYICILYMDGIFSTQNIIDYSVIMLFPVICFPIYLVVWCNIWSFGFSIYLVLWIRSSLVYIHLLKEKQKKDFYSVFTLFVIWFAFSSKYSIWKLKMSLFWRFKIWERMQNMFFLINQLFLNVPLHTAVKNDH